MTATLVRAQLRRPGAGDAVVIEQVFRIVHAERFGAATIPADMLASLLAMQFRAQQAQYRQRHELAVDHVIDVDGRPVGRCWVDRSAPDLRVLDLAVVPAARRRGVAATVLRDLQDEADAVGGGVRLSVWRDDAAARALYDSAGFVVEAERDDGYLELSWRAGGPMKEDEHR